MRSGSREQWLRLQQLNQFITDVDAVTLFDTELLANYIGFSSMRANLPARLRAQINELEDLSVAIIAEDYSDDKKQKAHTPQRYRELAKLLGDGDAGLKRLHQEQMRMLEGLKTTSLFGSISADQFAHCEDADDVAQLVQAAWKCNKVRLSELGLRYFNPVSGRDIAQQCRFVTSSEIDNGRVEIPFDYDDWFKPLGGIADYPPYIDIETIPVEYEDGKQYENDFKTLYIQDLLLTFGRDFPVEITIGTPSSKVGFCFLQLKMHKNTHPLVVPYLTGFQKEYSIFTKDDLVREASIRAHIAALIYFETLRVLVANKHLAGCPMRWIPWAVRNDDALEKWGHEDTDYYNGSYKYRFLADHECCGRVDLLMRLYEAGKKAGFPAQTWRKPIACLSGCPSSQGTDVSSPLVFS
jgi:hypothetical protein